jgi:hypothetical protein
MKCGTCGAINGSSVRQCDFCQTALYGSSAGASLSQLGGAVSSMGAPQVTFLQDALKLIGEINQTQASGFKVWAFIFPIGYLAGYGSDENAKKVASVILVPTLLLAIVGYLSSSLSNALSVVLFVWTIFVSYLVATRTSSLAKIGGSFALGKAVGFNVAYVILYWVILAL